MDIGISRQLYIYFFLISNKNKAIYAQTKIQPHLRSDGGCVVVRAPDVVHGEVVGIGLVHGRVIHYGPILSSLHVTDL